ncbi:MAG: septum formation initiator family protein [Parcubacteria group bacterium]|nr:septum formation initiator family protein [Parcubacteria group bacterium]
MPLDRVAKTARRSKWVMLGGAILFLMVAASFTKELMRSYQIKKEITRLRQEITELEGQNKNMSGFVEYLKTDAYFQEQARLKLGLKGQGEKVLVFTDSPRVVSGRDGLPAASGASRTNDIGSSRLSNPQKWLAYFFGS